MVRCALFRPFCTSYVDKEIDGAGFLELSEEDIKNNTSKMGLIKKLQRLIREVSIPVIISELCFPLQGFIQEFLVGGGKFGGHYRSAMHKHAAHT